MKRSREENTISSITALENLSRNLVQQLSDTVTLTESETPSITKMSLETLNNTSYRLWEISNELKLLHKDIETKPKKPKNEKRYFVVTPKTEPKNEQNDEKQLKALLNNAKEIKEII